MYTFETLTGTTWTVENGRITRQPGPYVPPDVAFAKCEPVVARSFRWLTAPVVGQQALFTIPGVAGTYETGTVKRINRPAVESYCRTHDMFHTHGCWMCGDDPELRDAAQNHGEAP